MELLYYKKIGAKADDEALIARTLHKVRLNQMDTKYKPYVE